MMKCNGSRTSSKDLKMDSALDNDDVSVLNFLVSLYCTSGGECPCSWMFLDQAFTSIGPTGRSEFIGE